MKIGPASLAGRSKVWHPDESNWCPNWPMCCTDVGRFRDVSGRIRSHSVQFWMTSDHIRPNVGPFAAHLPLAEFGLSLAEIGHQSDSGPMVDSGKILVEIDRVRIQIRQILATVGRPRVNFGRLRDYLGRCVQASQRNWTILGRVGPMWDDLGQRLVDSGQNYSTSVETNPKLVASGAIWPMLVDLFPNRGAFGRKSAMFDRLRPKSAHQVWAMLARSGPNLASSANNSKHVRPVPER